MKKLIITIIICFGGINMTSGQAMKDYGNYIIKAEALFAESKYEESADAYKLAFDVLDGKGGVDDRYNASKSYALAGIVDSAFYHLFRLADATEHYGISNIGTAENEASFKQLQKDSRWPDLMAIINSNREILEASFDKELVAILAVVFEDDQENRRLYIESTEKGGPDTDEAKVLLRKMKESDSTNLVKVSAILDEHGWLGPDIVGDKGSTTIFLVIQHASPNIQAKYLPVMREAVKNENAEKSHLAYLEDRVSLWSEGKQKYGSQIGGDPGTGKMYVLPLEDPINVNKRRQEVGLTSLEEYLANYGLKWDAEEYIKDLPKIEESYNEQKRKHSEN